MDHGEDLYAILGVSKDAEDVVIKAAWRALAQRYHPDKFVGSPEIAKERMLGFNRAFTVLSNPELRAEYDRERGFEGNGGKPPIDQTKPETERENTSKPASIWIRFLARVFDISIESFVAGLAIGFLGTFHEGLNSWIHGSNPIVFSISTIPLALLLDSIIAGIFGNTLGKAFFGLEIVDSGGRSFDLTHHIKRNLYFWFYGTGLFLPVIGLIAMAFQAVKANKSGATTYDEKCKTSIVGAKIGWIRFSAATSIVTLMVFVNITLSMVEKYKYDSGAQKQVAQYEPTPAVQEQTPIRQENQEQQDLLIAAQEIIAKFPQLDVNSPNKNQFAIDYVVRVRDGYIAKGNRSDIALRMAANDYAEVLRNQAQQTPTQQAVISTSKKANLSPTWYEKREQRQKCNIQPVMTDAEIDACR